MSKRRKITVDEVEYEWSAWVSGLAVWKDGYKQFYIRAEDVPYNPVANRSRDGERSMWPSEVAAEIRKRCQNS